MTLVSDLIDVPTGEEGTGILFQFGDRHNAGFALTRQFLFASLLFFFFTGLHTRLNAILSFFPIDLKTSELGES
jgi:hypothetical protein